jgi:hypothetical protein
VNRRGLVILSTVGLLCAVVESVIFSLTLDGIFPSVWTPLAEIAGGLASGVLAGIVLTAYASTRRVFAVLVPLLSGLASCGALVAIGTAFFSRLGPVPLVIYPLNYRAPFDWTEFVASMSAVLLYLATALLYRYAGSRDDAVFRTRAGLLVLLLFAIIPVLNALGFVGLVIFALRFRHPERPTRIEARPA